MGRHWRMGWDLQMASFCSLRHHPFIKQVHSAALITILHDTKGLFMNFLSALRKEISTSTEFDNYTNTTICALHHSGQNGPQAQ